MPIYEYRCPHCDEVFEKLMRSMGSSAPACPTCGNAAPEKLVSAYATVGRCAPSG